MREESCTCFLNTQEQALTGSPLSFTHVHIASTSGQKKKNHFKRRVTIKRGAEKRNLQ